MYIKNIRTSRSIRKRVYIYMFNQQYRQALKKAEKNGLVLEDVEFSQFVVFAPF